MHGNVRAGENFAHALRRNAVRKLHVRSDAQAFGELLTLLRVVSIENPARDRQARIDRPPNDGKGLDRQIEAPAGHHHAERNDV